MKLTFVGCGDAFGSGGRFNTCFHLERAAGGNVLIDCGASSMVAIRKAGVDPNGIAAILVTHLHGDHFGGLPFFILDAQLVSRRTAPLTIAGRAGSAQEILFRRVRLRGTFVPGAQFFVDNRIQGGRAGFHVIAPLELGAGGPVALVNRGWVARTAAYPSPPEVPVPAGEQAIEIEVDQVGRHHCEQDQRGELDQGERALLRPGEALAPGGDDGVARAVRFDGCLDVGRQNLLRLRQGGAFWLRGHAARSVTW